MSASLAVDESKCPLCGNDNFCDASMCKEGRVSCWCATFDFSKPLLEKIPFDLKNKTCVCKACLLKVDIDTHSL